MNSSRFQKTFSVSSTLLCLNAFLDSENVLASVVITNPPPGAAFFVVDPGAVDTLHEELSLLEFDLSPGVDFPLAVVNPGIGILLQRYEPTGPTSVRILERSLLFESDNSQDDYEARLRLFLSRPFDALATSPDPVVSLIDGSRQALRTSIARVEQHPNATNPYIDVLASFSASEIEDLPHRGIFFGTGFITPDDLFVRRYEVLLSTPDNAGTIRILGQVIPEPSSVKLLILAAGGLFCRGPKILPGTRSFLRSLRIG